MAKVVIFARNKICIDLIASLQAKDHTIAAVFSANAAPEYLVTKDQIREHCERNKIPFFSILNRKKIQSILYEAQPDIGLTANFPLIFDQQIISKFKCGIINAHGGDLPKYRGNACQAWAILNGEKSISLCAHLIVPDEVDCGHIIKKLTLPISNTTRVEQTINWIMENSCDLLLSSMSIILDKKQNLEQFSFSTKDNGFRCYPRKPEDGRIRWHHDFQYLIRLINASCEPYPGAFCFLGEQKLIIWRATTYFPEYRYQAIEGQILEIQSNGVIVAAKNGSIKITEAQLGRLRACPSKLITSIRERLT